MAVGALDLVVLGGHTWAAEVVLVGEQRLRVHSFFVLEPVFVVVAKGLVRCRVVAPVENPVTIIGADLVVLGGRQMELANQRAVVTGLGQTFGDQFFMRWKIGVPVAIDMVGGRVSPRQEARACGRADGALRVCVAECHSAGHQCVEGLGPDVGIAQRVEGVPALLVGAVPQDVGFHCSFQAARSCASSSDCAGSSTSTTTSWRIPLN